MVPRSEEIIKNKIIEQLTWDTSVNANKIHVDVEESVVKLTGQVENHAAKMAAEQDTYLVEGVSRVENRLEIRRPHASRLPGDREIEERVRNILRWNNQIPHESIEVTSKNHKVTLSGTIGSYWEKRHATQLVNAVEGVLDVNNEITVKPVIAQVDEKIGETIREAFRRNSLSKRSQIEVEVDTGRVRLKGRVADYPTKIQAHNIAIYTEGVTDVVDEMIIE